LRAPTRSGGSMHAIRPMVVGIALVLIAATGAFAGQATASQQSSQSTQTPPPKPDPQATPKPEQTTQEPGYKETVVVSASKTEHQLINAPATMSVISDKQLSVAPSNGYGDILRMLPGVNVAQLSARDVNVTSRASTSSLATSQLAVLDGRSLYQDFF